MTNYEKLVEALRILQDKNSLSYYKRQVCKDAADAIEELVTLYEKAEMDATNLTGKLTQAEAQLSKREEVWKDVIGYEGLYQVSDQARVRNNKGKILKQSVKVGKCVYYKYVKLYKDGQYRQGYVHRMMAECFIPNPDNLPIINHKDEDGTNNRLDNLEWCTVEYNSNYGNAKRNMSRGKRRRAKMEAQDG